MLQSGWAIASSILFAAAAFPVSLALTRLLMSLNFSRGIVGVDVHKLDKPKVPEMCGASIPLTLVILALGESVINPEEFLPLVAFASVVASTAMVGALDDKLRMRGIYKPLLALLCGLPILVLGLLFPGQVYNPTLRVPIFGGFHLPLIYPLSVLVAISVTSNTTNMLDPLNGTMAGSVAIIAGGLLIGLIAKNSGPLPVFLFAGLLFSCLGFFYFNRYPSRAFSGNVGHLAVGGALGAMAILGRVEIPTIVAMFPQIQNSFFFLSRIKRFAEHHEILAKPTRLLPDGRLASSESPEAPLTLVRTLITRGPATELEVVHRIFILFLFSSALALVTLALI
jgi:UDP-N-acetylglucosamine--dolichyl-phosphate N-acetylglucosaminephosphotransferase